ncbi:MAG: molybdopterin-dependent oxidoreductase [Polyangiaceae bacterium]
MSQHFATCTLCEAICGIVVDTDGDRVTRIRGDAEDPFSRGHICPKAAALQDLHEDPDRLKKPMRRDGERWIEMEWDEALDLVARRLREVQAQHGKDAVGVYQGNPSVHSLGAILFGAPLVRALRTRNRFSATSVDQLPQMLAAYAMFGHQLLLPIPDIDRTDHLLIFGANPVVSNGSLMTAPDVAKRIDAIRARGGRVVVLDPRRTETAEIADAHHFVRPGRDALVLAAMVRTLFEEGLIRTGSLTPHLVGTSDVRSAVEPFSPERVAPACGVPADTIRTLARDFAKAERAVCYGRVGLCTQDFGGLGAWLVNVLHALTSRLDSEGGAMFTRPAIDVVGRNLAGRGHFGKWKSRVRGLPEFAGELPSAALAEEIDTPGEGQIRAMVTMAGNPVLSTPNGARLDRALAGLDFMVSVDIYVNETTRHAHVILPPTTALERDHYDVIFHALAIRNTARFSPAVFPKPEGARHDWEILTDLTARIRAAKGGIAGLQARAEAAAIRTLGPRRIVDIALRTGTYGASFLPGREGLSLKHLLVNPHGVDLGALAPSLPGALKTRDKRVHLAPRLFLEDVPRLEAALAEGANRTGLSEEASRTGQSEEASRTGLSEGAGPELSLIGRRQLRSNNSWMHNSLRLVKGPRRCTLRMSPADARSRSLSPGDRVRVRSRTGTLEVDLEISDEMMPGVVSLPHGWGHDRPGVQLRVATAHPGASLNDLTDELRVDALSGTSDFVVPVTVERANP